MTRIFAPQARRFSAAILGGLQGKATQYASKKAIQAGCNAYENGFWYMEKPFAAFARFLMFRGLLLFGFPDPHHPHHAQGGTGSSCRAGQRDGDEHSRRPGRLKVGGRVQLSARVRFQQRIQPGEYRRDPDTRPSIFNIF